jgi:signal peptidase II
MPRLDIEPGAAESAADLHQAPAVVRDHRIGAAFSLFATLPSAVRGLMLDGLAAAAVVVLGVLLARGARPPVISAAFALIMGGAAGNLLDRAVRGRVVDFIYVHYYSWSYPVFNIADSAITIGVAIILIHSVFSHDSEA